LLHHLAICIGKRFQTTALGTNEYNDVLTIVIGRRERNIPLS